MTYQELLFQDRWIYVTGLFSRSGRIHTKVIPYVGKYGQVIGEAKNGQLLIWFGQRNLVSIPAGCVVRSNEAFQLIL